MSFVANFIPVRFPVVQKFWKSVKMWQSNREFKGGNSFFETQCSYTYSLTYRHIHRELLAARLHLHTRDYAMHTPFDHCSVSDHCSQFETWVMSTIIPPIDSLTTLPQRLSCYGWQTVLKPDQALAERKSTLKLQSYRWWWAGDDDDDDNAHEYYCYCCNYTTVKPATASEADL